MIAIYYYDEAGEFNHKAYYASLEDAQAQAAYDSLHNLGGSEHEIVSEDDLIEILVSREDVRLAAIELGG